MNKFLYELVEKIKDSNDRFADFSFEDNPFGFNEEIINFISNKLIVSISLSFFEKNLKLISNIRNPNWLEAIISLPVFRDDDNLLLLIFNADKTSSKFILIDETDCLLNSEIADWTYIENEIIRKYTYFGESDNSVIADVSAFIPEIEDTINDNYDEILDLKVDIEMPPSKRRVLSDSIADDILNLKEEKSVRSQISKHEVKGVEQNMSTPFSPLLSDLFYFKRRQKIENLLYKNEKKIIDEDVEFLKLEYLTDIRAITDKNDKDTILISTDKDTSEKLIYYNHEIEDFNGEIFIELDNLNENLSKEFLYNYLSSQPGIDDIMYFSKSKRYIQSEYLKHVKIPIPSLKTQENIVRTIKESRAFFRDVEMLKKEFQSNILDYKRIERSIKELSGEITFRDGDYVIENMSRSRIHAYKGLIWPLAISYLYATKGSYEVVERLDNYLTLFEFIAAFNAVILISGLPKDVYDDHFKEIWNLNIDAYKKDMSFGNWLFLCRNAGMVYMKNNFPTVIDNKLIRKITSRKIFDILFIAKDIRNNKYHGALTNKNEAKVLLDQLDEHLEDIYDILDVYSDYKLIYTYDYSAREDSHRVILLNGPCDQPIYEKMFFETQLEIGKLFLYNPKNSRLLKIKDSLMKFLSTDEFEKNWALFIYNSLDRDEIYAQYKCFQSKQKDMEIDFYDFEEDILR